MAKGEIVELLGYQSNRQQSYPEHLHNTSYHKMLANANANDGGPSTPIVIDSSTEDNKTETSTIASSPSPQKKHCKKKQSKDDEDTNLECEF